MTAPEHALACLLRASPDPGGWRAGMNDDDYAEMADWLRDNGVTIRREVRQ